MISKEFAITDFITSITGERTAKKCKKCDWSVKRDLATKIVYVIPKYDKFDICFGGKMTNSIFALVKIKCYLKIIIN